MADETTISGVWAAVGKLAVLVSLLIGILGIWGWYQTPSSHLKATVEIGRVELPPNVTSVHAGLETTLRTDQLKSWIAASQTDLSPDQQQRLAMDLGDQIQKSLGFNPYERIDTYGGYWRLEVENAGDVPLKDVVLRVPGMDVALVVGEDRKERLDSQGPGISLGELLPGQKSLVVAWKESSPVSIYDTRDISISHAGGRGAVDVLESPGWFQQRVMNAMLVIAFAPFAFALLALAYQVLKRARKKQATS